MATELEKQLERAEKALAKNKPEQAIEAFEAVIKLTPTNIDIMRNLADLYTRINKKDSANHYYGLLFDRYFESNDAARAVPLYRKNLESTAQPAERVFRYASLLHRQAKTAEALAAYEQAAGLFEKAKQEAAVFQCVEKIATLQPDSAEAQIRLGDLAQRQGKRELAAKAYLRAGQLVQPDDLSRALGLLEQAYNVAPTDRAILLSFAQAHLAGGNAARASELLMPLYAESEQDPAILATLGESLLVQNRLKEAEEVIDAFYQVKPDSYDKLFDLADRHCKSGQADDGVRILGKLKERFAQARRQKDFVERLETLYRQNETVLALAEFAATSFNEANQEGRYSEVLNKLFTLYFQANNFNRAADTLERLIDIDPYDFENQKRLSLLQGKIDPARHRGVASRISTGGTVTGQAAVFGSAEAEEQVPEDPRRRAAMLEDMLMQVEIFLQYALTAKAVENLQRIEKFFPGEEATNERLRRLYEQAQYFPKDYKPAAPAPAAGPAAAPAAPAAAAPAAEPGMSAETVSDLAKITEITHALYRQGNPKSVLHTAVSEVGKYLRASRCLGTLGRPGAPPSTAVEYCALGTPQSPAPVILKLLGILAQQDYVAAGSVVMDENLSPDLKQVGAKSILAVALVDKEKQEQAGTIVVQQGDSLRKWKPSEIYMLQAVADQVIIAVNHTRLRTLMKTMGVADETTGLLSRGNYLDCLINEATRAKNQATPLAITLLEIDKGGQLIRQVGEASVQNFMQQAGEAVLSNLRQSDIAIKYTPTALALVLPDTTAEKAKGVVEKMRKVLAGVKLADGKTSVTFSVGLSEAKVRPDFDVLDTVTDVINRAEFSLEEARKTGNTVAML